MLRLAMNWRDIASYLQMTPESVSRSLLRLKLDGALTLHGKHVQLRKQSALRELAHAPAAQALPKTATRH
jgi:CRP/FNR family transcriptional regulator